MRIAAAIVAALAFAGAAPAQSFTPLGHLPGAELRQSFAGGVSDDGRIVVGMSNSGSLTEEAFVWTEETGMEGLGTAFDDDERSVAYSINGDGSLIVGGTVGVRVYTAVRWLPFTGIRPVSPPAQFEYAKSFRDASRDGSTLVGSLRREYPIEEVAAIWTEKTGFESLGGLAGGYDVAVAVAVSADGSIVAATAESESGQRGFLWTREGGKRVLEPAPGWGHAGVSDLSPDGAVAVGSCTGGNSGQATRWVGGEPEVLAYARPVPGRNRSDAFGVSRDGRVIVGWELSDGVWSGTVWTEEAGMRRLDDVLTELGVDMMGYRTIEAARVTPDGRVVVGYAVGPSGFNEAFRAELAPTPPPRCSAADLTTTGARPGEAGYGVPDGAVDAADLRFFVRVWRVGCP